MGFFSRFKRRKRYKFNKHNSYDARWRFYGGGSYKNPMALRRKRKNVGYKISGYGGF